MRNEKLYPFNKEKQDRIHENIESSLKKRRKKEEAARKTRESKLLQNWLNKPEKIAALPEDTQTEKDGSEETDDGILVFDTEKEKNHAAKTMERILKEDERIQKEREKYESEIH